MPFYCADCGSPVTRSRITRCQPCAYRRRAEPRITDITQYLADRVVVSEGGCWLWQRGLTAQGYAATGVAGFTTGHRLSYAHHVGAIPDGVTVNHDCHVKRCVNPAHLSLMTLAENVADGNRHHAGDTCPHGHTEFRLNRQGHRYCLACKREWMRAYRQKNTSGG